MSSQQFSMEKATQTLTSATPAPAAVPTTMQQEAHQRQIKALDEQIKILNQEKSALESEVKDLKSRMKIAVDEIAKGEDGCEHLMAELIGKDNQLRDLHRRPDTLAYALVHEIHEKLEVLNEQIRKVYEHLQIDGDQASTTTAAVASTSTTSATPETRERLTPGDYLLDALAERVYGRIGDTFFNPEAPEFYPPPIPTAAPVPKIEHKRMFVNRSSPPPRIATHAVLTRDRPESSAELTRASTSEADSEIIWVGSNVMSPRGRSLYTDNQQLLFENLSVSTSRSPPPSAPLVPSLPSPASSIGSAGSFSQAEKVEPAPEESSPSTAPPPVQLPASVVGASWSPYDNTVAPVRPQRNARPRINQANPKTDYERFGITFQPTDPQFERRAIMVTNIVPGTTLTAILKHVRGGPILSATMCDTMPASLMGGTLSAMVTFVNGVHANEYAASISKRTITVNGNRLMIKQLDTPSYPPSSQLRWLVYEKRRTRVLQVHRSETAAKFPDVSMKELLHMLYFRRGVNWHGVLSIVPPTADRDVITITFNSIKAADDMYQRIKGDCEGWHDWHDIQAVFEGCMISFGKDPCDRVVEEV
ncbi:hypothetical protein MMC25_003608 [Agyrium rufum]|nr:hypothetical protein [Agyrium rufum]